MRLINNLIESDIAEILRKGKNLLAFSHGTDSTALFFILESLNINFDIAMVDYSVRNESKTEVQSAKNLAKKYNKKLYILELKNIESNKNITNIESIMDFYSIKNASDSSENISFFRAFVKESDLSIDSNFESKARQIRYSFFYNLIESNNYTNLLTAHHLNDRLEWLFMRLFLGASLHSLLGFKQIESRNYNGVNFNIIRPLINITKNEILEYNRINNIEFFTDKSNENTKYLRNNIRHNIIKNIESRFYKGIKKSFMYLENEREILYPQVIICIDSNLFYCKNTNFKSNAHRIHIIDILSKNLGYLLSGKQKAEIDSLFFTLDFSKTAYKECVMGDKIIIAINKEFLFVALNFIESRTFIPKKIREIYRKEKIPKKIREIMYQNLLKYSLKNE